MTIAIYGGSFDPPHIAHVLAVHYVLSIEPIDRVLVVPVYRHAFDKELTPFLQRVALCEAAFSGDSRISVSTIESELSAPSYTLHTLQALQKRYPEEKMRLVMGGDVAREIPHWHRFDEVEKIAEPLILARQGIARVASPKAILPEISSTEARKWFRVKPSQEEKRNRERLIPFSVRELIEKEKLYQ